MLLAWNYTERKIGIRNLISWDMKYFTRFIIYKPVENDKNFPIHTLLICIFCHMSTLLMCMCFLENSLVAIIAPIFRCKTENYIHSNICPLHLTSDWWNKIALPSYLFIKIDRWRKRDLENFKKAENIR